MEGGGIRGITYAGAIKALEDAGQLNGIENIAGTSVGALVGGLYAVGYSADELRLILDDLKLQQLNDGRWIFLGGSRRMAKQYGWYRGERLEKWIGNLIEAKTGNEKLTFAQLHQLTLTDRKYKDLYAVTTNLTMQRREVLYYKAYPNLQLSAAIRASISIPLYFGAVFMDSNGQAFKKQDKYNSRQVLIDGGVVANYPLDLFDTGKVNMQTIGLKLERPEQIEQYAKHSSLARYDINNFGNYVGALYNLVIEQLNKTTSFDNESKRTIYISTGNIGPKLKKIPATQKEALYNNGKIAVERFVKLKGK